MTRGSEMNTERDFAASRATRIARESHEYMRRRQGQYTCQADPLNPCWDNRPTDVVGQHWGGGDACANCTMRAKVSA
jgi:hypothetical protein